MTRVLAIEETDIRIEISGCDDCPLHWFVEAPDEEGCGLTMERNIEYVPDGTWGKYIKRKIKCPLPDKRRRQHGPKT